MHVSRPTRFTVETTLVNLRARLNALETYGPSENNLRLVAQQAGRTLAPASMAYVAAPMDAAPSLAWHPALSTNQSALLAAQTSRLTAQPTPHQHEQHQQPQQHQQPASAETERRQPIEPRLPSSGHVYAPETSDVPLPSSRDLPRREVTVGASAQRRAADLNAVERQLLVDEIMREQHYIVTPPSISAAVTMESLRKRGASADRVGASFPQATTSQAIANLFTSPIVKEDDHPEASVPREHHPAIAGIPQSLVTVQLAPARVPAQQPRTQSAYARSGQTGSARSSIATEVAATSRRAAAGPVARRMSPPQPHPKPSTCGGAELSVKELLRIDDRPGVLPLALRSALVATAGASFGRVAALKDPHGPSFVGSLLPNAVLVHEERPLLSAADVVTALARCTAGDSALASGSRRHSRSPRKLAANEEARDGPLSVRRAIRSASAPPLQATA
jgi:hypothetical protein